MHDPMADGQVNVDVCAVGMNFRNILISIGEVSVDYFGNKCANFITKAGRGV